MPSQGALSDTEKKRPGMLGVNENIRSNAVVDGLTLAVR
jgi:hypothetical protein